MEKQKKPEGSFVKKEVKTESSPARRKPLKRRPNPFSRAKQPPTGTYNVKKDENTRHRIQQLTDKLKELEKNYAQTKEQTVFLQINRVKKELEKTIEGSP